ncbi:gamma-glutamyltransferase, partial [filamentous cyanobacterium CCP5]
MRLQSKLTALAVVCLLLGGLVGFWPLSGQAQPVATGTGGAVASVDRRATEVGIEVLRRGGNAIDAAVATAAALGVVEPFSAGIGGGGFMVIYRADLDEVITLDGRETAPAAVIPDLFTDPDSPTGDLLPFFPNRISSGRAVGVPGTPLNWETALSRYGTLSLAEALAPAISLAENGFTVDATFASQIADNQERFAAFTSTRKLYLPYGVLPKPGSQFRNPDLAQTYRQLAEQGTNAFYRGEIAEAIVTTVQNPPVVENPSFPALPGEMTLADLDRYQISIRPAVRSTYRDYTLYGMGLPSSGGITVAQILNLLSGFHLAGMDRAEAIHTLLEAERLAFGDRNAYIGDPEYVDVPVPGLLNPDYATERRRQISPQAPVSEADFRAVPGNPLTFQTDPSPSRTEAIAAVHDVGSEGFSTTHLVTGDRFGNVVSYTLTIEMTGGSGMVVPGYGFILNNELTDFDPVVPHPNTPEAGKRPRSSMAPTIAFAPDGSVFA